MNSIGTMISSFILQILFLLCSLTAPLTKANLDFPLCSTSGNYTSTSPFLSNLNKLLSSLPTNTLKNDWFFNDTVGQSPDQVYGLAMCHYDPNNTQSCTTCLTNVARSITVECPFSTTAVLFLEECFLRYSNKNFFSNYSASTYFLRNPYATTDPETFNKTVLRLMNTLATNIFNSPKLVAVGDIANNSTSQKVYGLVECSRDLSPRDCQICVQKDVDSIATTCASTVGCRFFSQNCYMRYEIYPFYNAVSPPSPPPVPQPSPSALSPPIEPIASQGKKTSLTIIIAVVCAAVAFLLVITAVYLCTRSRKRRTIDTQNFQQGTELIKFDFNTIKEATSNFSDENKLGEGGFGKVFKGTDKNGRELAVKRLAITSGQGISELTNEIELLGRLKHRNLVQVVGYCIQEKEKLLCYEYLLNGSLDKILFATDITRRKVLDWETRFNIIVGICRGLIYLHVESGDTIIHRDLKASNILLDKNMNPKISDFGLARLFNSDKTHRTTMHVAGTFGYIAPESMMHLVFSPKSDVFSFGVLILEIVTGRSCTPNGLISHVWHHWTKGEVLEELKDQTLPETCLDQVSKCIHIALLCVQEKPENRPTISDVNIMLHSHHSSLPPLPAGNFIWSVQMTTISEENSIYSTSTDYTIDRYYNQSINSTR